MQCLICTRMGAGSTPGDILWALTMQTVQLIAQRRLESRKTPMPPDPGPGEVLVRLHKVGICGSDLHWYLEGGVGHNRARYPMVLGHEPVGEVVAAGPGVTTHPEGTRVAIEPSVTCGHCEHCLAGRHNNCLHCVFMGSPASPGFFREYAVVPARNAEIFPSRLSWLEAVLIEPVAVMIHVMEMSRIRVGDTVAILGAGPIGLLTLTMARLSGASRVIVADKVAHRLKMARQLGADCVIHNPAEPIPDSILEATNGRGADVVFDAAGGQETINAGIAAARPAGQLVLIGIPSERELTIDMHTAMANEVQIVTIKRSNHKGAEAMALLEAGRIPTAIVTHRLPLHQTPDAFEMVVNYRNEVGKTIIEVMP
jgi:L-iditol 2-dehydrogenase